MYRRLLRILRPHAWRMAGTIACSIGAAALDTFSFALLIPFLNALFGETSLIPSGGGWIARVLAATIGHLLNPADPMGSLQRVIFVILASVLAKNLLVWVGGQLGAQLQEYVTRDLRDSVYAHLQRLPLGFFQRTKVGQIISRVLADTEQTKALITQLVTASIQNVATIVGYVIFLFGISTRLTLYALIVAPLLMGSLQPLLRKLRKGYRRLRNDYGEITSVLQEVIAGIRLVKSYGAERYEERRFTEASSRYSKAMVRVTRLAFMAQPITEVIGMAIAVVLLWIGARQVLVAHTLAGASLITFLAVVMRLLQPLKQV